MIQKEDPLPKVAIIGKPNVGKSTIFNRLIGSREAIEFDRPMTTRDELRLKVDSEIAFELLDTAGMVNFRKGEIDEIEENVQLQVQKAVENADLLLFVIDAKEGISHNDISVAEIIRRSGKKYLFVSNKCEGISETELLDFSSLGLGVPLMVSAIHKVGLTNLSEKITENLRKMGFAKTSKKKAQKMKRKFALHS